MPSAIPPTSTDIPTGLAAVDALLQPFNRGDGPGLVVGIARNGKTLCRRGLGLASIEHGIANTPRTRMRIGSTSKHFACLAALLLAEEGRLSIDDSIHAHLPELPRLSKVAPTLRQLMNHTSGWRCHIALSCSSSGDAVQPKGAGLALLTRQGELNFDPGTRMLYCNGGYHLLTHVIERISGQRFERFLAERIFEPLGMHDTESVPSDFDIKPGMATLYQALPTGAAGSDAEWRRGIFPVEDIGGEGAIVSTVDDMLRWIAHLRGSDKRVGSAASWAQMTAPTVLADGAVTPYGLGLMRHSYRGVEVVRHGGTVIGGTCQMLTVPAHALDISIMTNGAKTSPRALAWKIVDALLAAHLGPPPAHVPSAERPALMDQPYYSPATGVLVRFGDAEGRLGLSWLGSPPMPLRSKLGRLSLASEDSMMAPISIKTTGLDGDVAPAFITLTVGASVHRFAHMNAPAPSAADLAPQLEGRYRVPDMDATACIARTGDTLRLHVQGPYGRRSLRLQPLSTDLFMIASDGQPSSTPTVGVIRIDRDADRVLGLRLEEGRTRGLRFVRETRMHEDFARGMAPA